MDQGNTCLAIGDSAGNLTQGDLATAIGAFAGQITQGENSLAIGSYAGNDTQGVESIAIGSSAGRDSQDQWAVAIGFESGMITQNAKATAVGYKAGREDQDDDATAVGANAGERNQGVSAVAIGTMSGRYEQSGNAIAIGNQSGQTNQGTRAIAIGDRAGETDQSYQSICIGHLAECAAVDSIAFGNGAAITNATYTNSMAIGHDAVVTGPNQIWLGTASTTQAYVGNQQGFSDARDKEDVTDSNLGLAFINMLRPVSFVWEYRMDYMIRDEDNKPVLDENDKYTYGAKDGTHKKTRPHYGLIAQEVKATMDSLGVDFGGYQDHRIVGGEDVRTLGYSEFIAPLIKAIQELSTRLDAAGL